MGEVLWGNGKISTGDLASGTEKTGSHSVEKPLAAGNASLGSASGYVLEFA